MLLKNLTLFLIGGLLYIGIELLYRGRSHWSMFLDGGLCFWLIGSMNEVAPTTPLVVQMMLGAAVITASELVFGLVFNRWLQLSVWDYSELPANFMGQISLVFSACWAPLAAVAVVADDALRLILFHEPWPGIVWF